MQLNGRKKKEEKDKGEKGKIHTYLHSPVSSRSKVVIISN
jgi:hypothetical protein